MGSYTGTPARRKLLAVAMKGKEAEFIEMWQKRRAVKPVADRFGISPYDAALFANMCGLEPTSRAKPEPEPEPEPEWPTPPPGFTELFFPRLSQEEVDRIADAVVARLDAAPRDKRRNWFR